MNKALSKKSLLFPTEVYIQQAELCLALSHPVRLMILDLLEGGEATATTLQKELSIPKSNLSQHIGVLKRVGIIKIRKSGLFQYLRVAMPEVKQACGLVRAVLLQQISAQASLARAIRGRQ
jgi:DNA-binding transcriptional ArsR family regulator